VLHAETAPSEPSRNLALIFRNIPGQFFLRHFLLKSCRHPSIPMSEVPAYQAVFRAVRAHVATDHRENEWGFLSPPPYDAYRT